MARPHPTNPLLALHRDQQGMMSLVTLCVFLLFIMLFSLLANVGRVTKAKLEAQNSADAVASAAGIELARGMNSITAAQQLIGEFHALVILVHALGGDPLDGASVRATPGDVRESVDLSYDVARRESPGFLQPIRPIYEDVRKELRVNGAVGDSRVELKKVVTWAYVVHAAGGSMMTRIARALGPYGVGFYYAGMAIIIQAMIFEAKAGLEWKLLDVIEGVARTLNGPKRLLRDVYIPLFHQYSQTTFDEVPAKAEEVGRVIGKRHLTAGTLFPAVTTHRSNPPLELPVEEERRTLRNLPKSQLVRASTPWVQSWRMPILVFAEKSLVMSRFKSYYAHHTQDWTLELTKRAKEGHYGKAINLYLIKDYDPDGAEKNEERWAKRAGSRRADELFGTIGFALRDEPPTSSNGVFRRTNPDGVAAFAQVMIYNANPQKGRVRAKWQPEVGWDTLNWDGPVPEWEYGQPKDPDVPLGPLRVPEPKVRVNWQEKLVPTTRLADSVEWQTGPLGVIVRRVAADTDLANTH